MSSLLGAECHFRNKPHSFSLCLWFLASNKGSSCQLVALLHAKNFGRVYLVWVLCWFLDLICACPSSENGLLANMGPIT